MKGFLKILVALLAFVVLVLAGGWIYLMTGFPQAGPAPDITVEPTSERVARGAYLANHVAVCVDCHSTRDWTYLSGPVVAGSEGKGGERFGEELGFPGTFYARNITPHAIGDWTDGELVRAITSGVDKSGDALFPVMPYPAYNRMSWDDLYSLVAYIRSLKPIASEIPARQLNFPMNLIVRTIPQPYASPPPPDPADELAYGEYLTTIAACTECHTPMEKGQRIAGMELAGGMEFPFPDGGLVRSANITPDRATGIGGWSRETFIGVFKASATPQARSERVGPGDLQTVMPWTMYGGMTEEDLGAIYTYLRTVAPVENEVEIYPEE